MSSAALPGFRDFYPAELAERSHIFAAWRDVARRYGFSEYDGPPLEPLELYTRKSGEEIVGQLYAFTDKGGRAIALRPEMTPTFARMVGARANALRKPVRWFSVPQLFRYERQQKGRLREHYQLNVDIVGEADVTADAELVAAAVDMVRALGLTSDDVVVRISDRRLLGALLGTSGVGPDQLPALYGVIDKVERQPRAITDEKLGALGLGGDAILRVHALLAARTLDEIAALAGGSARAELELLRRFESYLDALLGGAAPWIRFDLSIVRGLAYYTGIVFELFDRQGEFRAICGGGRYDDLLGTLGGVHLPALGFGMGDVVLGELLRARGLMPVLDAELDYWVAGADDALLPAVMRVSHALRARGRRVEFALRPQPLGKQLKAADAAGARAAVILGADFAATGAVRVRSLSTGDERTESYDHWLATA